MSSPFPTLTIPTVPTTGSVCLWQVHKTLKGKRVDKFSVPFKCPLGATARATTHVELTITSAGAPCDQDPGVIPNASMLVADGFTLRRTDGLAHFVGTFKINNPKGGPVFAGELELFQRVGSHVPPYGQEACNIPEHVEGWLIGRGDELAPRATLRALVVGKGWFPEASGETPLQLVINGVLLQIS